MIPREEYDVLCADAAELLKRSGEPRARNESARITAADSGLGRDRREGPQILTFLETHHTGSKLPIIPPGQEHRYRCRRDIILRPYDIRTSPEVIRTTQILEEPS